MHVRHVLWHFERFPNTGRTAYALFMGNDLIVLGEKENGREVRHGADVVEILDLVHRGLAHRIVDEEDAAAVTRRERSVDIGKELLVPLLQKLLVCSWNPRRVHKDDRIVDEEPMDIACLSLCRGGTRKVLCLEKVVDHAGLADVRLSGKDEVRQLEGLVHVHVWHVPMLAIAVQAFHMVAFVGDDVVARASWVVMG